MSRGNEGSRSYRGPQDKTPAIPKWALETPASAESHCLGTFWTDQEIAVIDTLAKRQDFSHVAVLRNALRNYQLAVEGTPDVGALAAQAEPKGEK